MTISTTESRIEYLGNGTTAIFAIPFRFLENSHIVATLTTAGGEQFILSNGADYTMTGADNDDGGFLTMISSPTVGSTLVIRRVVPATQETDYISGDPFPAESHERALDKLTMLVQQGEEVSDRTLKFPVGDLSTQIGELPAAALRTNRLLGFDAAGKPVVYVPSDQSAASVGLQLASFQSALASPTGSAMVGFQQLGVGAIPRSAQSKMRDIVSVKDFGAAGDNNFDDTLAFQRAITYLNTRGGGRLFIPAGRYITGTIIVSSNIWLVGEGRSITTIKLKDNTNADLIYGEAADTLWGTNSSGGVQNVGLFDITLDGNRTANSSGNCVSIYGEELYFQNLSVTEARGHGIRTEWYRGDSVFGMESNYTNVRIDRCGMDGWLNNGPHDSVTFNMIVIDASLNTDRTFNGLTVGPNMTGRWIGCHVWNRQASNRHGWAVKLEAGGGGNEFVACHFEGAWLGNAGIFSTKNIFDSTCRFYSAWNGVNVYLGGTATFNIIRGQLDSPGAGRPESTGVILGGAPGDYVSDNVIDVSALDQTGGAVRFSFSDGNNRVTARAFQSSGVTVFGTPHPRDIVDITSNGGAPARVNNIEQFASLSLAPNSPNTWVYPYPFAGAPYVTFSPQSPSGAINAGIWIAAVTNEAVSIYNDSSATVTVQIKASRS